MSCSGSSTLSTYAVMSVTSTAYSSSHSCVRVPGERGAVVYPWSPGPVTLGRSCLKDARYSTGRLLASRVGWSRCRALDRCVQGACSRGGGARGGIMRAGVRGAACCGLELRRGEVHMMLRVLRVLELQF